MSARVLDGRAVAAEIRESVRAEVAELTRLGSPPKLTTIVVGNPEAGLLYARSQERQCAEVGIRFALEHLAENTSADELGAVIDRLNHDDDTTGIMLHLPLPPHLDAPTMQLRIDPYKDVEGVTPANIGMLFYDEPIIVPCTGLAVLEMIRRSGATLRGAEAVVVGQGMVVGKPVTMSLLQQMATVTACHADTRDLRDHTRRADILVVAVGQPELIDDTYVRPGAVVIDVGINHVKETGPDGRERRRVCGDVRFEAVARCASAITPVPGGVGPVTVAMLLRNIVHAARKQRDRRGGAGRSSPS